MGTQTAQEQSFFEKLASSVMRFNNGSSLSTEKQNITQKKTPEIIPKSSMIQTVPISYSPKNGFQKRKVPPLKFMSQTQNINFSSFYPRTTKNADKPLQNVVIGDMTSVRST